MLGRFGLLIALFGVIIGVRAAEPVPVPAPERYELAVRGTSSLADFAAVQTVLRSLPGVKQLRLLTLEGDTLVFSFASPSLTSVEQALAAEVRLPALKISETADEQAERLRAGKLVPRMWQPDVDAVPGSQSP